MKMNLCSYTSSVLENLLIEYYNITNIIILFNNILYFCKNIVWQEGGCKSVR